VHEVFQEARLLLKPNVTTKRRSRTTNVLDLLWVRFSKNNNSA